MFPDLAGRLSTRAGREGIEIAPEIQPKLIRYIDVLWHWNRTINLTSLDDPDDAIDRLLLEPLAAARDLPRHGRLMDLGSGGGSPAIPLALALSAELVMVESRTRKSAFLREVVHEIGLSATVETCRFEDLAHQTRFAGAIDVISVRAVRMAEHACAAVARLLRSGGVLAIFRGPDGEGLTSLPSEQLRWVGTHSLLQRTGARVTLFERL